MKKLFLHLVILLCFSSPRALALSKHNMIISKIVIHNGHNIPNKITRDIILLKEGEPFDLRRLDASVDNLRKWNVFNKISVRTEEKDEGVVVHFLLDEGIVISGIDISGNYPFIESEIKKRILLKAGDIYVPAQIDKQIERIKEFYNRNGYFNTQVTVKEKYDPSDSKVFLTFIIKRGKLLRYGKIEINGNRSVQRGRIVSMINPILPYNPKRLKDAVLKIRQFYRKKGFIWAIVRVDVDKDFERSKVNLKIDISEGRKVKVLIKGNKYVSKRSIKKALTIYEAGILDSFEITKSIAAIRKLYADNGYPNAKINIQKKEEEDGSIKLTIYVQEHKRVRVKSITFIGNKNISSRKLKLQMLTKENSPVNKGIFNEATLKEDIKEIERFYQEHGFLNAKVRKVKIQANSYGDKLHIRVYIDEGNPTILKKISVKGDLPDLERKLLKNTKLKPGNILSKELLVRDRNAVLLLLSSQGYPYAEVKQEITYNVQKTEAYINYTIKSGPKVRVGRILVVGNLLTKPETIKKMISLKEGDIFIYQKVLDSELALRRMSAFNNVKIETIGLETKEKTVHILVRIEERRPFQVNVDMGYNTDEGLTGSLSFSNINSFGWAKMLRLKLIAGQKTARSELSWIDPRLFGFDVEMMAAGWLLYEDRTSYNYVQTGGKAALIRRFHRTSFMLAQELNRNYFVSGNAIDADADNLRDTTLLKSTISASFDTRNSFAHPTKGLLFSVGSDFLNEVRGNQESFARLGTKIEHYVTLLKSVTLANILRFDHIQEFTRRASIPSNELLYMGGDNTLRGFARESLGPVNSAGQPVGGKTRIVHNAEIRFPIWHNLKGGIFLDTGTLTNSFEEIDVKSIRNSAGVGIRYITPVGPIRADYGIKLDRQDGEGFGRFHLTFGWIF